MEDVHHLRVFEAVADKLSFTRAAEALRLTQSGVSHQIAALERAVGTRLLHRDGRAVTLTPAGQALRMHLRRIFAALDEARTAVRQAAEPGTSRLRIGASSTACQYIIPEALREFRESFPACNLAVVPGDSPVVMQHLLEGTIDLGLLVRRERVAKLEFQEMFTDELGYLVSPLHPWARTGRVDRRQLGEQRMVLYSRHSATFQMVERFYIKQRAPLRDWIELGSMEAIKELVKLGLGVSMIAPWIARAEIEAGALVWLAPPGPPLRRSWCIAWSTGRSLSMLEQTFVGLCQAAASHLLGTPTPPAPAAAPDLHS
jgi:DNA-binding transcriptional LysR family regulator